MPRREALAAGLTAALLLAAPAAWAQSDSVAPAPAGQVACSFGAFVSETDPEGLNVRAGPGTNHKVVGTLPPVKLSGDDPPVRAMVEVEVSAGANGWFRIAKARDNEMLTDAAPRPMFKGSGWVSGRKLTVKSQAAAGRQRPDGKAQLLRDQLSLFVRQPDSALDRSRRIRHRDTLALARDKRRFGLAELAEARRDQLDQLW